MKHQSYKNFFISALVIGGLLGLSKPVGAADKVGNGGDGVVCFRTAEISAQVRKKIIDSVIIEDNNDPLEGVPNEDIVSVSLLDLWESQEPVRNSGDSPQAILTDIKQTTQTKINFYSLLDQNEENMKFEFSPTRLSLIFDSNHTVKLPAECAVFQLATQTFDAQSKLFKVLIDQRLYQLMSPAHQAALRLHELIYNIPARFRYTGWEDDERTHDPCPYTEIEMTDSTNTRKLVRFLMSANLRDRSFDDYKTIIKALRFDQIGFEYYDGVLPAILVPVGSGKCWMYSDLDSSHGAEQTSSLCLPNTNINVPSVGIIDLAKWNGRASLAASISDVDIREWSGRGTLDLGANWSVTVSLNSLSKQRSDDGRNVKDEDFTNPLIYNGKYFSGYLLTFEIWHKKGEPPAARATEVAITSTENIQGFKVEPYSIAQMRNDSDHIFITGNLFNDFGKSKTENGRKMSPIKLRHGNLLINLAELTLEKAQITSVSAINYNERDLSFVAALKGDATVSGRRLTADLRCGSVLQNFDDNDPRATQTFDTSNRLRVCLLWDPSTELIQFGPQGAKCAEGYNPAVHFNEAGKITQCSYKRKSSSKNIEILDL